jgi:hypothetical protein
MNASIVVEAKTDINQTNKRCKRIAFTTAVLLFAIR